jgi:hypothetical protein
LGGYKPGLKDTYRLVRTQAGAFKRELPLVGQKPGLDVYECYCQLLRGANIYRQEQMAVNDLLLKTSPTRLHIHHV